MYCHGSLHLGWLISAACPQCAPFRFNIATSFLISVLHFVWAGSSAQLAQHRPALALLTARPAGALPCRYSFIAFRLLVALLGGRDLLLFAKHLFVAARTRQSSTKDRAGSVRRVMVVAGREATYPGPGAKAHHRAASAACPTLQTCGLHRTFRLFIPSFRIPSLGSSA
jgi:hypothetical protein